MGAIQSAINQGLATAGILYSQSDLAEQRKKDFADKRELKDIEKQLGELSGARETLENQAKGFVNIEIGNSPEKGLAYLDRLENKNENIKAGLDLYQDMSTKLGKRRFELTKDPIDLKKAQLDLEDQRLSQKLYDDVKAAIAKGRTLQQQKIAKSIKPKNFYKELREMEVDDKQ